MYFPEGQIQKQFVKYKYQKAHLICNTNTNINFSDCQIGIQAFERLNPCSLARGRKLNLNRKTKNIEVERHQRVDSTMTSLGHLWIGKMVRHRVPYSLAEPPKRINNPEAKITIVIYH